MTDATRTASNRESPPRGMLRPLRHPAQLAGLSVMPLRQPRPRGMLVIDDGRIEPRRRREWEAKLNRAYRACGCAEASLGMLVGLLGGGVWLGSRAVSGAAVTAGHWFWLLGIALAGCVVGKTMGLMRGQARLRRLTREIAAEWPAEPRPAPAHGDWDCG